MSVCNIIIGKIHAPLAVTRSSAARLQLEPKLSRFEIPLGVLARKLVLCDRRFSSAYIVTGDSLV